MAKGKKKNVAENLERHKELKRARKKASKQRKQVELPKRHNKG